MNIIDKLKNKFWRIVFSPKASVRIENKKYSIPRFVINDFYISTYQSEKWLVDCLKKIHEIKPIENFIDVGVNIGQTMLKVKAINEHVSYFGFEPNPICCSIVQKIISINNFSNTHIIPCGLFEKSKLLKLMLSKNNIIDSGATLVEGFRNQELTQNQYVAVLALDDIFSELDIKKIDMVKIDIEGAELDVINGMMKVLFKYKPIIIMEVLPSYDINNKFRIKRQNELANVLKDSGYIIYQIINSDKEMTLKEVNKFPIHKNVNESDYILLPQIINVEELGFA